MLSAGCKNFVYTKFIPTYSKKFNLETLSSINFDGVQFTYFFVLFYFIVCAIEVTFKKPLPNPRFK